MKKTLLISALLLPTTHHLNGMATPSKKPNLVQRGAQALERRKECAKKREEIMKKINERFNEPPSRSLIELHEAMRDTYEPSSKKYQQWQQEIDRLSGNDLKKERELIQAQIVSLGLKLRELGPQIELVERRLSNESTDSFTSAKSSPTPQPRTPRTSSTSCDITDVPGDMQLSADALRILSTFCHEAPTNPVQAELSEREVRVLLHQAQTTPLKKAPSPATTFSTQEEAMHAAVAHAETATTYPVTTAHHHRHDSQSSNGSFLLIGDSDGVRSIHSEDEE